MNKFQRRVQGGFTLIELAIVVVLVGILSAVAIPKYIDFKDQAGQAAADGVAGALATASALNFAASKLAGGPKLAGNCPAVEGLLVGGLPSTFTPDTSTGTTCKATHTDTKKTAAWNVSE